MRVHVIVIASKPGQLANRLFVFAHFIALSQESGIAIADPAFDEYGPQFEGTHADPLCRFPSRPRRRSAWTDRLRRPSYWLFNRLAAVAARVPPLGRWVKVVRIDWWDTLDLLDPTFIERASRKLLIVQGWLFSVGASLSKHADTVRAHLTPIASSRSVVERVMSEVRRDADVVVGIHVRRGDYSTFLGGKYFYPRHTYLRVMNEIADLFPDQRVRFLVCSDASHEGFGDRQVSLGPGTPIEDLYCLAACDRIAGPPSTFSLWASFYGQVPLFMIHSRDASPTMADFKVYGSQFDFPEVAEVTEPP